MNETPSAHRWFVLVAASLGAFLATVTASSVNVAIPSLVEDLGTPFSLVQWVVLAYLLTNSVLLPIVGRAADLWGKKPLFLVGYAVYTLCALLCGAAGSIGWLIGFRALQGVGSALLVALSLALVTDAFPDEERGRALGVAGAVLSSGVVVGPTLGGLLIDALSWRWVFLMGVPIGLVGAILAWRVVPAGTPQRGSRFDLAGAGVLLGALLSLLLALTLGQERGFGAPLVLGLFGFGALMLAGFVGLELRTPDPLLDLRLFRSADLSIGLVSGLATFVAISGAIFLLPFYLENVLGYTPRGVGLLMAVAPVALVVVSPISGSLSDRFGVRPVTVVGLALILTGYLLAGTLGEETTALGYVLRFLPLATGMATFQSPNNSAVMGSVPRSASGTAGGLLSFTRTFGQTAGIAVLGTIWAAVAGGADAAPAAQVAGLRSALVVNQVMIALALALCVWDLVRRARRARAVSTGDLPHA